MIIKSTRVPAGRSRQIARYLSEEGENEDVSWLKGDVADIVTMGEIAQLAGKAFSVRHFSVSPNERMTMKDLAVVVQEICREFEVPTSSASRMVIVQHKKVRGSGSHNGIHWHVILPEINAETCKTLSSAFYKIRNEKVSRVCELRLGQPLVHGRFSKRIARNLRLERPDLFVDLNKALANVSDGKSDKVTYIGP